MFNLMFDTFNNLFLKIVENCYVTTSTIIKVNNIAMKNQTLNEPNRGTLIITINKKDQTSDVKQITINTED